MEEECCSNKVEGLEDEFDKLGELDIMCELNKYDEDTDNGQKQTNTTSDDTNLDKMMQEMLG